MPLRLSNDPLIMDPDRLPPSYLTDTRGPNILAAAITCQLISTTAFAARTYSRIFLLRTFRLDDYVLLVAWVRV